VDDPGEHTFKIGLRAALLASRDLEQRKRTRAVIEATYRIRSALVHAGEAPARIKVANQGKRPAEEVVSQATAITAEVIKRILLQGQLPEWERMELSDEITPLRQLGSQSPEGGWGR